MCMSLFVRDVSAIDYSSTVRPKLSTIELKVGDLACNLTIAET